MDLSSYDHLLTADSKNPITTMAAIDRLVHHAFILETGSRSNAGDGDRTRTGETPTGF